MAEVQAAAGSAASAGLAGLMSAASGGSSGAAGLFTQFIGAASSGTVSATAGTQTATAGAQLPAGLQGLVSMLLGEGSDVQVTATSQDMSVLVQRIEVVVQKLQTAGISLDQLTSSDGGAEQLSAALQVLGMSSEAAQDTAERIEAALKLAKEKLNADDSDMSMLAAMMMAGTAAPQLPALPDGEAIQVTVTSVQVDVRATSVQVSRFHAKSDMARDMILAASGTGVSAVATSDDVPVDGLADGLSLEFDMGANGLVMHDGDGNAMVVAQPAVADANAAASASMAVMGDSGMALDAGLFKESKTTSPVEKVLDKPSGDVMYVWRPDDLGVDQVKPTQEAHRSMENLLGLGGTGIAAGGLAGDGTATDGLGSFSDRLANAMRHDVTQQASVQMQKLGEQGGGQVRMVLNPPELGEIQIDLTVKDGVVHGSISAHDGAVVELLAKEVQTLRHGLADAGLKVGQEGISLMLSNNGQQQAGQQGQQAYEGRGAASGLGSGELAGAEDGTIDAMTAIDPAAWVSPDRLVDVRV